MLYWHNLLLHHPWRLMSKSLQLVMQDFMEKISLQLKWKLFHSIMI
nr:unnamed protein product [Callosobruchus chinensis]